MPFSLPTLPYASDALAPLMSKETIDYHYGRHLQTYIDKVNALVAGTEFEELPLDEVVRRSEGGLYNNAAQAWNHIFFFDSQTPQSKPVGTGLHALILRDFGSVEAFREQLCQRVLTHFASGWVWLIMDCDGKLAIVSTQDAQSMLADGVTPLLTIDLWEHAYYIDHRNRRADYFEAVWQLIDWEKVENRLNLNLFDGL